MENLALKTEIVKAPRLQIISIITVVKNDASNIKKTIQSVLNQSYSHIQYIIIDGSSTDGTLDIINEFKDKIDTITSEPDRGIYDAMNKGIHHAQGEWIFFLNSGDVFFNDDVLLNLS